MTSFMLLHEDLYGTMWFSTEKGVSRLVDGQFSSFTSANGLGADFVVSLESTPDSSVWMGTYGAGLSRFHKGEFTRYTEADGLPGDAVFGLYQAAGGDLWVATGGGAAVFDGPAFYALHRVRRVIQQLRDRVHGEHGRINLDRDL